MVGCGLRVAAEVDEEFVAANDAVESELEIEILIKRSLPLT